MRVKEMSAGGSELKSKQKKYKEFTKEDDIFLKKHFHTKTKPIEYDGSKP